MKLTGPTARALILIAIVACGLLWAFTRNEEGLKRLRDEAISSLPQGSEHVAITNVELNPLQIEHKQTYLIELTFTFFGEKFACYSLTLDRRPEAISFRLTCRQKDYSELRQVFHKSLFTWQNL